MPLEAIKYNPGSLLILDQLLLPHQPVYVPICNTTEGFDAIRRMVVRGAPAIAIVAMLSLAVELQTRPPTPETDVVEFICGKLDYIVQARPTAVNLSDAARKLKVVARGGGSSKEVIDRYIAAAGKMLTDDIEGNKNIGKFGAEWVLQNSETIGEDGKVAVMTHCNTGSLATAGYGTALGIIRSLHSGNHLSHAYCTETRPYNQGSRLTAYELVYERIPGTLITDSMAAALMCRQHEPISAVIVGADRVAANGDTANKIGTYQLAIVARHHGVKFVVAAPTTSIDLAMPAGTAIEIEHRPKGEVTSISGPCLKRWEHADPGQIKTVSIAANGIGVFNPAFDVTPKALIDAIVTDKGVAVKDADGNFDLSRFF